VDGALVDAFFTVAYPERSRNKRYPPVLTGFGGRGEGLTRLSNRFSIQILIPFQLVRLFVLGG
jgi:hypothetical protein